MTTLTNQELFVTRTRLANRIFRKSVILGGMRFKVSVRKYESSKKSADRFTFRQTKRRVIAKLNDMVKLENIVFKSDAKVLDDAVVRLEPLGEARAGMGSDIMRNFGLSFEESKVVIDEDSVFVKGDSPVNALTSHFHKVA